jgi:hypothetical protein
VLRWVVVWCCCVGLGWVGLCCDVCVALCCVVLRCVVLCCVVVCCDVLRVGRNEREMGKHMHPAVQHLVLIVAGRRQALQTLAARAHTAHPAAEEAAAAHVAAAGGARAAVTGQALLQTTNATGKPEGERRKKKKKKKKKRKKKKKKEEDARDGVRGGHS